jgi:hypothetical protein
LQCLFVFSFYSVENLCRSRLASFLKTKVASVRDGKGGLYGNVIRTGMMPNSTRNHIDELVVALDVGFALC